MTKFETLKRAMASALLINGSGVDSVAINAFNVWQNETLPVQQESYIPLDSDEIVFKITGPDGKKEYVQCGVGYDNEWRQCLATLNYNTTDSRTVNSSRTSDDNWGVGMQTDGSLVEVWVKRKDGTEQKIDIQTKKYITPAQPIGFSFDTTNESRLRDFQPNEPVGSVVELADKSGNRFLCTFQPDIGVFVMVRDAMGNWVGSNNWSEGLYMSADSTMPTVSTNCNTVVNGKDFIAAKVNGKNYVVPKHQFKPTTLVDFKPNQKTPQTVRKGR